MKVVKLEEGQEVTVAFIVDPHIADSGPRSRKDDYFATCINKISWLSDNHDY